jgi:taurine dioxygenase
MVEIRRMGPQIGVEVRGVDVKTLNDAGFAPIYQAWLDCNILCVRDQDLTIPDFLAYSRRFGPIEPHPSKSTRHPEYPEITMLGINKFDDDGNIINAIYRRGAEGWHTDGAYDREPFRRPSSMRWRCRAAAATRCFATPMRPMTRCPKS